MEYVTTVQNITHTMIAINYLSSPLYALHYIKIPCDPHIHCTPDDHCGVPVDHEGPTPRLYRITR